MKLIQKIFLLGLAYCFVPSSSAQILSNEEYEDIFAKTVAEVQSILAEEYLLNLFKTPETQEGQDEDAFLTVPEIIEKYGYPSEIHYIRTPDNYTLQVHRIPYGKTCGPAAGKRVVWLQHGLMGDSSNWIITGPNQRGLAYELAEECYDVWMGNFRGNTYSKNHTYLDPVEDSKDFWDFSFHELGLYDVPSFIDYALTATGAESLYYIGHSMGTTSFFVALSLNPSLASKVKLMSALALVTYNPNTRSIPVRAAIPFLNQLEASLTPPRETLPIEWTKDIAATLCKKGGNQELCATILFIIGGFNKAQLDYNSLPAMLGHAPAGASSKMFFHYGHNIRSGNFSQYDYGKEKNLQMYDSEYPPQYNLENVKAPIAIYFGDNDFLADKTDVMRSIKAFPKESIVHIYRVDDIYFNHLDFIWAKDQHSLINRPIIEFMEAYTNPAPVTEPNAAGQFTTNLFLTLMAAMIILCSCSW